MTEGKEARKPFSSWKIEKCMAINYVSFLAGESQRHHVIGWKDRKAT